MRKNFIAAGLFIFLMLTAVPGIFGQSAKRITFKRGARSAVVTGNLYSYAGKKVYVIRVRAGQVIRTEQVGTGRSITIAVLDPRGEIAADSDASCNNRKESEPTIAGDYKIIVTECMKADPWRGSFKFKVWVE
jgi:hypothetical protein